MSLASLPPYEEDPREFGGGPDRTPPQDVQAEQSALGAMLLSKDAIGDVAEIVRGRDFYLPKHEQIYDAIIDLFGRGEPADAITVADELAKRGELGKIGGHIYLHDLLSMVSIASNAVRSRNVQACTPSCQPSCQRVKVLDVREFRLLLAN